MLGSLSLTQQGKVENTVSPYQDTQEVKDFIMRVLPDLQRGHEILRKPFKEFNMKSPIERANIDQKDWLSWSPDPSDNPDESWMFNGNSNITRDKIISTASHLTQQIIFPGVFAQNDLQEEDKDAGYVCRSLLEYDCRSHDYQQTFLYAVIAGLVNPVTYFQADFCQGYMSILEGTNSEYTRKQVIDDVMSGFQHALRPIDEVLFGNPYCFDWQKQPFNILRRRISYKEAESYYGSHRNFVHVRPGVISLYNKDDGVFYDAQDEIVDTLVEEVIFKYRQSDIEVPFINGIYFGNDNVDYNPFRHRTNKNKPEYNIAKFGAEPIDAKRFWAYKSLSAKIANDKELVDRMRQNAVDASTIATFPWIFTTGAGKVDGSVMKPATVTEIGKDAKVISGAGYVNPDIAYRASKEAQEDINKSTSSPQSAGVYSGDQKTLGEAELLQQNAMINLGIMGRMIGSMVKDVGTIMLHDSLRYRTLPEIGEIVNGIPLLNYKSYNVGKAKNGRNITEVLKFTDRYAGKVYTKKQKEEIEVALAEKYGKDSHVWEINPDVFINLDVLVLIEPDQLFPKSQSLERAQKLQIYDKAINNPLIAQDPEKMTAVTRDFLLEPVVHGDTDKYLPDPSTQKVINGIIPNADKNVPISTPTPPLTQK